MGSYLRLYWSDYFQIFNKHKRHMCYKIAFILFQKNKQFENANAKFKFMVKSKFTFYQYFRRGQTWSNFSQNKVNIRIFSSKILQWRPCPCKLSSGYIPPALFTAARQQLIDVK